MIERAVIVLHRIANGRAAQNLILYGLQGVGKTVLLHRIRLDAEDEGYIPVVIEAPGLSRTTHVLYDRHAPRLCPYPSKAITRN